MLIGITGKAGSGKDSFASFLVRDHGFQRLAFADAVRDAALAINPYVMTEDGQGWIRLSVAVDIYGWDYTKRNIPEARRILQVVGTNVGRQILGDNVWIDIVKRKIQPDTNYVFTDMRFPNELEFIESLGGITVKIIRPHNPDAIESTHASETAELVTDWKIYNSGSLEELKQQADEFCF